MNISGLLALVAVASLIGRVVKSAQQSQAKRSGQKPTIPYEQNQPQATSAHESAAKPKAWNGASSLREMIDRLEQAASDQQNRKDPAVNFSQAFEEVKPIPKKVAPFGEGLTSTEGTVSTQGLGSGEGRVSTQGIASTEGMKPASAHSAVGTKVPAAPRRSSHGYFSNVADLKRAVVMSEVLGKPVSLRKRRVV